MIGERQEPDLKCHFSADYNEAPWWKINFKEEYAVKSVKVFNLKNGASSSNIADSTIYVGETICAQVAPVLPENDFVKFTCEEAGTGPINVFEANRPSEYGGTPGKFLKIQSLNPGVLAICDIEIEIQVVDQKVEEEIDDALL